LGNISVDERIQLQWKMDLMVVACDDVYLIHLTQDINQWLAFVNMVMNLQVSLKAGNFLTN
jgi:hypothetical protein